MHALNYPQQHFMHLVQSVLGCLLLVYLASATAAGTMLPHATKAPTGSEGADHKIDDNMDALKAIDNALNRGVAPAVKDLKDDVQTLPEDPEGHGHHPGDDPDGEENRRRRRLGVGDKGFKEEGAKTSRRRKKEEGAKSSRRRKIDGNSMDARWKAIDNALSGGGQGIEDLKDDVQTLPENPEGQPSPEDDPDAEASRRRRRLGVGDPGFKEEGVKASRRRRRTQQASRRRRRKEKSKNAAKSLTNDPVVMDNHEGPDAWVPKSRTTTNTTDSDAPLEKRRIHYDPPM